MVAAVEEVVAEVARAVAERAAPPRGARLARRQVAADEGQTRRVAAGDAEHVDAGPEAAVALRVRAGDLRLRRLGN